jgi:hypothetical protein
VSLALQLFHCLDSKLLGSASDLSSNSRVILELANSFSSLLLFFAPSRIATFWIWFCLVSFCYFFNLSVLEFITVWCSKHAIKCTRTRLDLLRRKKQAMVKFLKKDVADLLINGLESHAFGRVLSTHSRRQLGLFYANLTSRNFKRKLEALE